MRKKTKKNPVSSRSPANSPSSLPHSLLSIMGQCLQSLCGDSSSSPSSSGGGGGEEKKTYSWDERRSRLDPKDFIIDGLQDATEGRLPTQVAGQQFIIRNCENSRIYVFDWCNTVTIDDCKNCQIFLGPVKTSVFVRDCDDVVVFASCQQFRTRDAKRLTAVLCVATQPIIESSTHVKFGCLTASYPELPEQFSAAGLSPWNNNWFHVHDFSPVPGQRNWSLLPLEAPLEDLLPIPTTVKLRSVAASFQPAHSHIPRSLGPEARREGAEGSCLVVFFHDKGNADQRARDLLQRLAADEKSNLALIRTCEMKLSEDEARDIFQTTMYERAVRSEAMIGLEIHGPNSINVCHMTATEIVPGTLTGTSDAAYVSHVSSSSEEQIEKLFTNFDVKMN